MRLDIVIPIYNAYEYTTKCVESVLLNTKNEKYNLVLINDKSTDVRIEEYLSKLESKKLNNVYILRNENNLGFVQTVNKGMKFSENDVVLLNSDTEVTKDWLTKIKKAAYLNENIATVTPLTNNGTICSVPNYCEDNELPEGLSLDEYADIIEKTSLRLYPDIPTAVGFCMYIKRKVINEIGLFDSETFGKGYGEENDFCCRALEHGYTHVLCDDTFIYHKGSTSFLGDKNDYILTNSKILSQKYPYYNSMVSEFVQQYSIKPIINNIKFQLSIRNNKKNVLVLLHNDFMRGDNHAIGGTEYHVKDIVSNSDLLNYYIMYVHDKYICIQVFNGNETTELKFEINSIIKNFTISSRDYREKVNEIIDYFAIDCIHVHHLKTHTFDIVDIAKEKNIPIYLTVHDFYLLCPKINLLDHKDEYCIEKRNELYCKKCLNKHLGYDTNMIKVWNTTVFSYLGEFTKIFTPSNSAKEIFEEYYSNIYGEINFSIEVIEHGVENIKIDSFNKKENSKFKVAFLGSIAKHKGTDIVKNIIYKSDENIEWHIFGNIEDPELQLLKKDTLIKHGRYSRNDIVNLLNKNGIDLICILSIWPETYSYTLSEAIQANIPVIVADIGALGERVKRYDCGWTIPLNSNYKKISEQIKYISINSNEHKKKISNIKRLVLPTKVEVASKYEKIYSKSSKRYIKSNDELNKKNLNLYRIYNISKCSASKEEQSLIINELQDENNRLNIHIRSMENTIGWKALQKLRSKNSFILTGGKKTINLIRKLR